VSQLATWAHVREPDGGSGAELAWRSLERQSFFTRASVFPESWLGIWTAPDALESRPPGGTWSSPVTPMTDFPALNQNPHSMALLALLRVAGIEPVADGLRIAPRVPRNAWILDLPLLRLSVDPGGIDLTYRPVVSTRRTFRFEVPAESGTWPCEVDGVPLTAPVESGFAQVGVDVTARSPVRIRVLR
jgi:hypothetical protein